jgi:hypothetical protein
MTDARRKTMPDERLTRYCGGAAAGVLAVSAGAFFAGASVFGSALAGASVFGSVFGSGLAGA